jgi:hypothetical protein
MGGFSNDFMIEKIYLEIEAKLFVLNIKLGAGTT